MSFCRYCKSFVDATKRIAPKGSDGETSKYAPMRRLCEATKQWKEESDEKENICPSYVSCNSFWCDRLQQCMDVDSCMNKKAKKMSRHCKRCAQYYDVVETVKLRRRTQKPPETVNEHTPATTIIRRRTS